VFLFFFVLWLVRAEDGVFGYSTNLPMVMPSQCHVGLPPVRVTSYFDQGAALVRWSLQEALAKPEVAWALHLHPAEYWIECAGRFRRSQCSITP
jgi:hypothetical protein